MNKNRQSFAVALALLMGGVACAQAADAPATTPASPPAPRPVARGPELGIATEAVQAALAKCKIDSLKVAAMVTDSAGDPKVVMVSDGATGRIPAIIARKAAVALEFKMASSQVATLAKSDPAVATRVAANPAFMAVPGAVLLQVGDEIIGAIAVGGAKSEQDEACAIAGLDAVKARLK
jgi:uncharacterized protein GlcG (DUF336 family)